MNKSLIIVVSVVAVAVIGYIVYMSYFAARATVGKDAGIIGSEEKVQPPVMPTTDEQKLDALNNLTSSANASTSSDSAKIKVLESAASPANTSETPRSDEDKIKLLESLKSQ